MDSLILSTPGCIKPCESYKMKRFHAFDSGCSIDTTCAFTGGKYVHLDNKSQCLSLRFCLYCSSSNVILSEINSSLV